MFIISRKRSRGNRAIFEFLTTLPGNWTHNRLDAARFDTRQEAEQHCVSSDMHAKHVGLDGHAELYKGHLVQIFKKKRAWRVRIVFEHSSYYGRKPHHRPERALIYGKTLVRCGYDVVDEGIE